MLLRNLTRVYISKPEEIKDHGETNKKWIFEGKKDLVKTVDDMTVEELDNMLIKDLENVNCGMAFLNLQQDLNELDAKSTGEVNYDIYKARTDKNYEIKNGYGISLTDISKEKDFIPEYRVLDQTKIGNTIVYRLERYYGD